MASLVWIPVADAATAGQITHLSGTLSAKRADGTSKLLSVKSDILEGDTISTETETYARIKFADGGEVVMRPGTQLKIENYTYSAAKPESDNIVMSMFKGGLRAVTGLVGKRNREKVSFQTETATIGIRGTHFGALLCQNDCGGVPTTGGKPPPNGLHVDVTNGAITLSNRAGTVQINAGQFGFVANSNTAPIPVPPQQGIQVTMPTSISQNKGGGKGIGKGDDAECKM
ncbi:MAG: FecR domain-containing protein [Rhodocyclales bacterium]|nr:FecR domain-containing protein [Rhodocyclales bacterium]